MSRYNSKQDTQALDQDWLLVDASTSETQQNGTATSSKQSSNLKQVAKLAQVKKQIANLPVAQVKKQLASLPGTAALAMVAAMVAGANQNPSSSTSEDATPEELEPVDVEEIFFESAEGMAVRYGDRDEAELAPEDGNDEESELNAEDELDEEVKFIPWKVDVDEDAKDRIEETMEERCMRGRGRRAW